MSNLRFWMDVFNAAGERQGQGFISTVESLTIKRVLDGVGNFSITLPETDPNVKDLVEDESRVKLYVIVGDDESADYEKRLLISGIIRKRTSSETTSGWTMNCTGDDELDELTRENVMIGLEYNAQNHSPVDENWTLEEIVNDLLSLVSGWTLDIDETTAALEHYARFDGMNIIEVLIELSKQRGVHFRSGDTSGVLEVGSMGEWNNLSLVQPDRFNPDVYNNDDIGFIQDIRITSDTSNVWNKVAPFTSGDGETRLDLEPVLALRGTAFGDPYDIETEVRNGKTFYFLQDDSSIANYGVINRGPALYDQIQIQSGNSPEDILAAADALYDITAVDLGRHSVKLETFDVTAVKLVRNVRVGDKIHMTYKGRVQRELDDDTIEFLPERNINALFWVMAVTETINASGLTTRLSIASIDRVEVDDREIIVGEIKRAQVERLAIKAYTSNFMYPDRQEIDSTHDAVFQMELTTRVLRVRQVTLRIITMPFRTTSQGGAAGGDHRHRVAAFTGAVPFNGAALFNATFNFATISGTPVASTMAMSLAADWYTEGASGTHTHDPVYGIEDDTEYPEDITVDVDGVDVTSLLANRGTISTGIDEAIDITEYIANSSGGLQSLHEITVGCLAGQGLVKVIISVYEDIQNLG
jgi:hypothetical protein